MQNLFLFLFDLLTLPITIIRLLLIYFFGSRYGIKGFEFIDIMLHAENKYFNQQEDCLSVDTITNDIRVSINKSSLLNPESIPNEKTEQIIPNEKAEQNILNEKTEQIIPNEKPEQIIPNEKPEQIIPNEKPEQIIPNEKTEQENNNRENEQTNNTNKKIENAIINVEKIIEEEMKGVTEIFSENLD